MIDLDDVHVRAGILGVDFMTDREVLGRVANADPRIWALMEAPAVRSVDEWWHRWEAMVDLVGPCRADPSSWSGIYAIRCWDLLHDWLWDCMPMTVRAKICADGPSVGRDDVLRLLGSTLR